MKKLISLIICLTLVCTAVAALADATVTVKGNAVVYAEPDQFSLSASVTCTGDTAVGAQQDLSDIIAKVTEALAGLGLDEDCVTTSGYSCYPEYDYSGEERKLIGYRASHTLSVTANDVTLMDAVITALSNNGITDIYSVTFDVSDKSTLYAQALTAAVEASKEKAQVLAAAMGFAVVEPTAVKESSTSFSGYTAKNMTVSGVETSSDQIVTGINSGSVSVTASVEMEFLAR